MRRLAICLYLHCPQSRVLLDGVEDRVEPRREEAGGGAETCRRKVERALPQLSVPAGRS